MMQVGVARRGYELGPKLDQGEGETDELGHLLVIKGVRVYGWFGQR
jgi:hypothetical protein